LTAAAVASQALRFGGVAADGDDIYWIESRPGEGGRSVLVRRSPDGAITDVVPAGFNVRTRVHEYGGGAYVVSGGRVYFSNFADQRVYTLAESGPVALTLPGACFYADFIVDDRRRRLIAVREDHTAEGEAVNTLVSIPLPREVNTPVVQTEQSSMSIDGGAQPDADGGLSAGTVIASGADFYSTPRLSPDGRQLIWLTWRHPQMPWDGTELWLADVLDDGTLGAAAQVAGGASESIYQPGWSPDGALYYVSDRDGWWRIYRSGRSEGSSRSDRSASDGDATSVLMNPPADAEFGRPQWVFGTATWGFAGPGRLVTAYTQRGRWHLAVVDVATGAWRNLNPGSGTRGSGLDSGENEIEPHDWLVTTGTHAILVAGSAAMADAVVRLDVESGVVETLRESSGLRLDPLDLSVAEPIEFETTGGRTAHAFYYAPRNAACSAPDGELPPLIAIGHGGPTTATAGTLDPKVQFWTTRGFAVVDVNYGGSSGYGRDYRERLAGQWGIVDVADMVNAARHLVVAGKADPHRLIIRGGSAGGYTTLAALTFHAGVFGAGASYYGISDIEVLASDTHKFESRYLDRLVGPYPEMRDVYRARSPIHFVDQVSCPVILFQGLEDKVVPPNQSQMMADAVRAKGLPVAYLTFEGEQHGFRRAETIIRSLEAELFFYGVVFGFEPADRIEPVPVDNRREIHGTP
jgi:dipeptidyl aminopeptidase/acylaminoacyl peptidase